MKKFPILVLTGAVLVAFAVPAIAKSTVGGIVYTDVYFVKKNQANNSSGIASGGSATADELSTVKFEVPNITRLRAQWTNEDDLGIYLEFGIGGASGATGVNTRHAYGTYEMTENWQILAGHSTSPFSVLFPNQLLGNNAPRSASGSTNVGGEHNQGKGYGEVDSGRGPQVRFTWRSADRRNAIAVALLDPNQGAAVDLPSAFATSEARASKLPRLDIGAAYTGYSVRMFPSAFYQKQSYNGVAPGSDDEASSWGASFGVQTGTGPFEISAELTKGQNLGNVGLSLGNSIAAKKSVACTYTDGSGTTRIGDTDATAYWVDLGWKLTSQGTQSVLHLVYGQMETENGSAATAACNFNYKSKMIGLSWPFEFPWIAKGLTIRPEYFIYDEGRGIENGVAKDFGKEWVGGVQFQFTF